MTPRLVSFLFVFLVFLVGLGCNSDRDPTLEPEEREVTQEVYDRHLASLPDSVRRQMSDVDTLFVKYDSTVLQRLRPDTAGAARWVEETLAGLTLEEKIGQLFIVELPRQTGVRRLISDEAMSAVERHGVGGFLVSRIMGPREVFRQTTRLQEEARVPLFFAADYERGAGRFSNTFTELPSNMALGATRDPNLAAAAGRLTAIESRAIGVNFVFAPVVDVNNNPDNPIINIRSYGERPDLVGRLASAFVREAEEQGLLTTLKHYPGHGNTHIDTHAQLGAVTGSRTALDSIELAPYYTVLREQELSPAGIMTAHLWIEAIDDDPIPATFSERALGQLLRDTLGFRGLVVTDDVKMGALQNEYSLAERTVRPLEVGADIILTPENLGRSIQAVKRAVEAGRISEERIDRSVRRVLEAKARAGLHRERVPPEDVLDYLMEEPRGEYMAQAASDRAITLLKSAPILPLRSEQRALLMQLSNYRGAESIDAAKEDFARVLGEESDVQALNLDDEPTASQRDEALEAAQAADVVVLALYLRLQSGRGEAGLFPEQRRLVEELLALETPVVLVTFGNPYAATTYPTFDAALVAYDQTLASVFAAARVLQGRQTPSGRLPITVEPFSYGSGLANLAGDQIANEETAPATGSLSAADR